MAENIETPAESVPLSRVYEVESLPANRLIKFELTPNDGEIEALKAMLGLTGLKKMRMRGEISPLGAKSWLLEAELGATVSQLCVVSADPVRTRIDALVRIKFVPESKMPDESDETELDEELDVLGKAIDIGIVATEALALEIPLYPRKEGAEFENTSAAPIGEAPMTDADVKPFAGLAGLKEKLENKP